METYLITNEGQNDVITNYRKIKDVFVSEANGTSPFMKPATFAWVYKTITSTVKKKIIEQIRSETDDNKRKEIKDEKLGYFNIGVFKDNYRLNDNLISSEFILLDFDKLSGDINELKDRLRSRAEVYSAFISPSGNGLKVIFRIERPITDPVFFSQLYKYYASLYNADLGFNPDHTSDVSRPCYFSYDPAMYVNENAIPLQVDGIDFPISKQKKGRDREEVLKLFESAAIGSRHTALTSIIGTMIKKKFDQDFAMYIALRLDRPRDNQEPLPVDEVTETVDNMYHRYCKEDILEDFWSQGKEIYQIGFVKDKFFIEKIGKDKFNIIIGERIQRGKKLSQDELKEEVKQAYSRLVIEKHIKHLARVDYLGCSDAETNDYQVKLDEGVIEVQYSMLSEKIQDNQLMENYLSTTFGVHKEFIKKYLAVYCHSNFKKLPTLILFGQRGTGKSTFAEIMMEIFPAISYQWNGNEQNFTPESEKKLLIVEENNSDKAAQYKTLKKYTGQKYALVHKKFKDPYMVKNNMNIIILSNENIPLYLKKEELPTDESNNQFFVMEFKKFENVIDNTFQQSVIDRLGHYIRTELRSIYESLTIENYRYSIPVPITKEERDLFNVNTTEIDADTDSLIQRLTKKFQTESTFIYRPFLLKRYLPVTFITEWGSNITKSHKNALIKNLKKRKMIDSDDPKKIQLNNRREYCYRMSEEFFNMLTSEFEECL